MRSFAGAAVALMITGCGSSAPMGAVTVETLDAGAGGATASDGAAQVAQSGSGGSAPSAGGETAAGGAAQGSGGDPGAGGATVETGGAQGSGGAVVAAGGSAAAGGAGSGGTGSGGAGTGGALGDGGIAPGCSCSSGPCCDGCNFRPNTVQCGSGDSSSSCASVVLDNGCPGRVGYGYYPGGVLHEVSQQWCTGASSACDGRKTGYEALERCEDKGLVCQSTGPTSAACVSCPTQ